MEDPNLSGSTRRRFVKDEMSSPDITAPSRLSLGGPGKQSNGEGCHEFRCELAPNLDAYIDLI